MIYLVSGAQWPNDDKVTSGLDYRHINYMNWIGLSYYKYINISGIEFKDFNYFLYHIKF